MWQPWSILQYNYKQPEETQAALRRQDIVNTETLAEISGAFKYMKGGNRLITIRTQIEISAPIDLCFDLARDIAIHTQTVWKHTKEIAIGGITAGPIGYGQTVIFQATHFHVRQTLTSKITKYEEPFIFVDEMQKGAFKTLKHIHEFKEVEGKTLMIDTLHFEAPFGFLGKIVEKLILENYMKRFIEYRNDQLKKIAEEHVKEARENTNF
ncbi:SRPBCC family protein [Paenibacillus sp. 19GGS1-52]|uniref:SRPBCC family protein n=1 Tax=Paenibacillus sp. 19GGS1-52 TaxID=2758563 RepID=UPI0031F2D6B3